MSSTGEVWRAQNVKKGGKREGRKCREMWVLRMMSKKRKGEVWKCHGAKRAGASGKDALPVNERKEKQRFAQLFFIFWYVSDPVQRREGVWSHKRGKGTGGEMGGKRGDGKGNKRRDQKKKERRKKDRKNKTKQKN